MAKTMRRVVITAILLIALAGAAVAAVFFFGTGTSFEGARTGMINTAIDQLGIKSKLEDSLRQRAANLAEKYGLPSNLFDGVIDELAIKDWKAVDTPTDAKVTKTVEVDVEGSPLQVTLYDDPSFLSIQGSGKINTFGQTITLKVPESAQGIAKILPYYDAAEEAGILDLVESLGSSNSDNAEQADAV